MREILRWDAQAVVEDLHDSLIIVASGLNRDLTTAIYRIRRIIEQVDPHLREFARVAPYMTAFAGKVLRDTNVLELVIKDAQRAPDLLMHVKSASSALRFFQYPAGFRNFVPKQAFTRYCWLTTDSLVKRDHGPPAGGLRAFTLRVGLFATSWLHPKGG
jgi:hypothetical protein